MALQLASLDLDQQKQELFNCHNWVPESYMYLHTRTCRATLTAVMTSSLTDSLQAV